MIFQVVAQFEVYVKAKLGVIPSGAVLQAEGGISRVPNPHFGAGNIPRPLEKTRVFETLHQAIRKLKLSHYHIPVRLPCCDIQEAVKFAVSATPGGSVTPVTTFPQCSRAEC